MCSLSQRLLSVSRDGLGDNGPLGTDVSKALLHGSNRTGTRTPQVGHSLTPVFCYLSQTDPQQPGFKSKPTQIPSQVFNPNAAQSSEETPVKEVERVNQLAALKPPLPVKQTSVSRFFLNALWCFRGRCFSSTHKGTCHPFNSPHLEM